MCKVLDKERSVDVLVALRRKNIYAIYTNYLDKDFELCLFFIKDECVMWHKCFEYVHAKYLVRIVNQKLVSELLKITLSKDMSCNACSLGNHVKTFEMNEGLLFINFYYVV